MLTLVTPPTSDPVSVFDLKTQLRIDGALEDPYLLTCLRRAQTHLTERVGGTGIACLTSTWDYACDTFPYYSGPWPSGVYWGRYRHYRRDDYAIALPLRPVQSVTSVKYIDAAGVEQTMAGGTYTVHLEDTALIVPAYNTSWPTARAQLNAVTVRFVAGWTGSAAVPPSVRHALVALASHFYTHRDDGEPLPELLLAQLLANERVYA